MKRILKSMILVVMLFVIMTVPAYATNVDKDFTMAVTKGCYTYTKTTATSKYRDEYVNFGKELKVVKYGKKWTEFKAGSKTLYILSENIEYKTMTVIKNKVMVSPKASACKASNAKGYVYYGSKVSTLGAKEVNGGKTYVKCKIAKVYTNKGKLKSKNVIGYINAAYLEETSTPKVVNGGTSLYSTASSKNGAAAYIYSGEQVEELMRNSAWAKIRYNNKVYYISVNKVAPYKVYITANRVMQTLDAKPGSGYQHYVYWNQPITVLNTYESDTYGTYYYCKISGDYGFVREYSSSGVQYVGTNETMTTTAATSIYKKATDSSKVLKKVNVDTEVSVLYSNSSWVKVKYSGTTGYMLKKNLAYTERKAKGNWYSSAYNLHKNNMSGTLNETVKIVAEKTRYGYVYVQRANGKYCWMKSSSIIQPVYSKVYTNQPSVTLHTAANNSSKEVYVPYMTELQYVGKTGSSSGGAWHKVLYKKSTYYVWLDSGDTFYKKTKSTYKYTGNTKIQQEILDLAMDIFKNWPTKYAHGMSDGVKDSDGYYGFDCSGFASYVTDQVMQKYVPTYDISANIATLYNTGVIYNKGYIGQFKAYDVNLDEIQPGDIVFFKVNNETSNSLAYNHCGIYLGNNEFAHSSSSWGGGVSVMPLTGIYEKGFVKVRRYIPSSPTAANTTMYTTSLKTYVYTTQNSDLEPADTLGKGEVVTLKYTSNTGNWAYVNYNGGKSGYILTKYLSTQ